MFLSTFGVAVGGFDCGSRQNSLEKSVFCLLCGPRALDLDAVVDKIRQKGVVFVCTGVRASLANLPVTAGCILRVLSEQAIRSAAFDKKVIKIKKAGRSQLYYVLSSIQFKYKILTNKIRLDCGTVLQSGRFLTHRHVSC